MKTDLSPIHFEVEVPASLSEVWAAWTTEAGVKSFFAPQCTLDFRLGGAYEMYFDLDAPAGLRGGEGCLILAIEPFKMFSFTWNAPPEFPAIRDQRTHVVVRFNEIDAKNTRVSLTQDGWGSSKDWQNDRRYFERAWGEVVLPRLVRRFTQGPVLWQ